MKTSTWTLCMGFGIGCLAGIALASTFNSYYSYQKIVQKIDMVGQLVEQEAEERVVMDFGFRDYHLSHQISEVSIGRFEREGLDSERQFEKVGIIGASIVQKIMDLEGVNTIYIEPYRVRVIKAKAFEWEPIDSQIKKILGEYLKPLPAITTEGPTGSSFYFGGFEV